VLSKEAGTAANATSWCAGVLVGEGSVGRIGEAERQSQGPLLRDIVGNPFATVAVDRRWLTASVRALARDIYGERAFHLVPVLGDALDDAGCENESVLRHCRGGGPHVLGCWVVDLLLGKK
jgi:hypothetical protein